MGILSNRINRSINIRNSVSDGLMQIFGINDGQIGTHVLGEATYFTSLKMLSQSVGKLDLELYRDKSDSSTIDHKHYLNGVLRRPNPHMTAFQFWGCLELHKNHYGNGYAYVHTERGKVKSLHILDSERVQPWIDDAGLWSNDGSVWYVYTDIKGRQYKLSHDQVIHHKSSVSFNGITGLSARECLCLAFDNAKAGQKYINTLFNNGLTAGSVVYYTGDLDEKGKILIQQKLMSLGGGSQNAGGILPLPLGMELKQLSQNLVNSQFLELNKYNATQISAVFGIKPSMLNDYSNSKYASVETEQQSFYVDTLMPILVPLEDEISYKLLMRNEFNSGYNFEFNIDAVIRADFKTRIEALSQAVDKGIFTPNEARKTEGKPPVTDGDTPLVNGTYVPLSMVGKPIPRGGE
ncbi:phage portal protein [Paenibacillus sp. J5C_2022]|uniref:phage portal protein n=1 Tax=Paenibacillus sp. J5C2022 TaxID=2977129 RepID=UPI0021D0C6EA|nr:phage portal protein [Paenibacillus sp. J5C2022]MCU6709410.1 phage portal protein [Paenibacillus sp. J5C2022]